MLGSGGFGVGGEWTTIEIVLQHPRYVKADVLVTVVEVKDKMAAVMSIQAVDRHDGKIGELVL